MGDAAATNLADLLEFGKPLPRAPRYRVTEGSLPTLCGPSEPDKWLTVAGIAQSWGWI
jgi:hypothetical protein